jgi:hypothetical protein
MGKKHIKTDGQHNLDFSWFLKIQGQELHKPKKYIRVTFFHWMFGACNSCSVNYES